MAKHNPRSPNEIDIAVGGRMRKLRLEANITLQDLASRVGISHQQLQKYETGMNRISAGMLPIVAEALGVELLELYLDADPRAKATKSKTERLRYECETVLRRVKSEEKLAAMLRVLKAMAV